MLLLSFHFPPTARSVLFKRFLPTVLDICFRLHGLVFCFVRVSEIPLCIRQVLALCNRWSSPACPTWHGNSSDKQVTRHARVKQTISCDQTFVSVCYCYCFSEHSLASGVTAQLRHIVCCLAIGQLRCDLSDWWLWDRSKMLRARRYASIRIGVVS